MSDEVQTTREQREAAVLTVLVRIPADGPDAPQRVWIETGTWPDWFAPPKAHEIEACIERVAQALATREAAARGAAQGREDR